MTGRNNTERHEDWLTWQLADKEMRSARDIVRNKARPHPGDRYFSSSKVCSMTLVGGDRQTGRQADEPERRPKQKKSPH